jgi:hypothetical protein
MSVASPLCAIEPIIIELTAAMINPQPLQRIGRSPEPLFVGIKLKRKLWRHIDAASR